MIALLALGLVNLAALGYLAWDHERRITAMSNDFSALTTAVNTLGTNVTAVQAEVASLEAGGTSDQPTIDAITANVQAANTALAALVPAPPAS